MICDSHVHVVATDTRQYPRIDEGSEHPHPANPADEMIREMDAAGIARCLAVQAFFTYAYDNRYAVDTARAHPDRFTSVCIVDPVDPASPDRLSDLVENHGVRGLRLMNVRGRTPVRIDDPQTFPLWERASALGITVSVAALLVDADAIRAPLERFPDVRILLDDIWGWGVDFAGPFAERMAPALALAAFPNFTLKIGPTITFAAREKGRDPVELYQLLIDRLGADRVMWGSNYPVRWGNQGSLRSRVDGEQKVWSFLPAGDREKVFSGNFNALWPLNASR